MDPITIIVAALAAGAVEAARSTVEQAVKDAYTALKELVSRKLGSKPNADSARAAMSLAQSKPGDPARQAVLKDELQAAGIDADTDILKLARALSEALERAGTGISHHATVSGGGAIAQGPGATAVGAGGVFVGGSSSGSINTGTQIVNHIYGAGAGADPAGAARPANPLAQKLYEALNGYAFNLDDMEDVAFELGVDWDSLRGENKGARARAMVEFFTREDRLDELHACLKRKRPRYAWT